MDDRLFIRPTGRRRIATWIILIASHLLVSFPILATNDSIKISADPWEPWVLGRDGELASGGIAIELSKELFSRMKLPIEINIYPYKRCIAQMVNGERDVLLMVKKTREREKHMLFSDVIVEDPQLIYYTTDRIKHFEWNEWEDLKGYSIGGVLGFNYGYLHTAARKFDLPIELVSNDSLNIKKLFAGRLNFILLSQSTARHYLSQHPEHRHKLKAASKPVANAKFYFGISKKGKAIKHLNLINKHLNKIKEDGTLEKILQI